MGDVVTPPLFNHRYRILKRLGEGSTAQVYLAEDTLKHQQRIALKKIHPLSNDQLSIERMRNEFATLCQFEHPNIVRDL